MSQHRSKPGKWILGEPAPPAKNCPDLEATGCATPKQVDPDCEVDAALEATVIMRGDGQQSADNDLDSDYEAELEAAGLMHSALTEGGPTVLAAVHTDRHYWDEHMCVYGDYRSPLSASASNTHCRPKQLCPGRLLLAVWYRTQLVTRAEGTTAHGNQSRLATSCRLRQLLAVWLALAPLCR